MPAANMQYTAMGAELRIPEVQRVLTLSAIK
jgi:hypothetical protein